MTMNVKDDCDAEVLEFFRWFYKHVLDQADSFNTMHTVDCICSALDDASMLDFENITKADKEVALKAISFMVKKGRKLYDEWEKSIK